MKAGISPPPSLMFQLILMYLIVNLADPVLPFVFLAEEYIGRLERNKEPFNYELQNECEVCLWTPKGR